MRTMLGRLASPMASTAALLAPCALLLLSSCNDRWCQTWDGPQFLCDDFDENKGVAQQGAPFTSTFGSSGGTFALSDNAYTAPNSALGTANPFEGDGGGGVVLTGGLFPSAQPAPPVIQCQVQIQPNAFSTTAGDSANVFSVSIADSAGGPVASLTLSVDIDGNASLDEAYPPGDAGPVAVSHPLSTALTSLNWSLFELTLSSSGATFTFTATLDQQSVNGTLPVALPPTVTIAANVGPVDPGAASTGWSFFYDDLLCH